jgi:hypothetical protein
MGDEFDRTLRDAGDAARAARDAVRRAHESGDPEDEAMAAAGINLTEQLMSRLTALQCSECGTPWLDPAERWQLLRLAAPTKTSRELVMLCPTCFVESSG